MHTPRRWSRRWTVNGNASRLEGLVLYSDGCLQGPPDLKTAGPFLCHHALAFSSWHFSQSERSHVFLSRCHLLYS